MRCGWRAARAVLAARPRLLLALLAAVAFALALARPAVTLPASAGSAMLVVDITQSMNVADMRWQGEVVTRLAYTRALLRQVVAGLPCGYRAGVAVFTERKSLALIAPLEVCAHFAALDDVLAALDWRMAWAADSHIHYGVYSALQDIERHHAGSALAFFTDGHQAPALFAGREPRYERHDGSPPGVLFGVGGSAPQPVPRLDADGRIGSYWTTEDAAAFASTGAAMLSVQDMERMAAGDDVRNAPQRPAGADAQHLSARRDDVLQTVAERAGLQVRTATRARDVIAVLQALPGARRVPQRVELHAGLVALGALALLLSLAPAVSLQQISQRITHRPATPP
jgi:mxaL protein